MLHKTSDYIQGRLLLSKFYGKVEFFQIFCRYHEECLQLFKNPKDFRSAQRIDPVKLPEEHAMRCIARFFKNSPDKFWTSTELDKL